MNRHATLGLGLGLTLALGAGLPAQRHLTWSTLHGGSAVDRAYDSVRAADGRVYVVGQTWSKDLPVTDRSTLRGSSDAYVACFDPARSGPEQLVWATYVGGDKDEQALACALDATGSRIAVVGQTDSTTFVTSNGALQRRFAGGLFDGFVVQLDAATGALRYGTYVGGDSDDWLCDVAVESTGYITAVGTTYSKSTYPTSVNALKRNLGGVTDSTLTTLDPTKTGPGQMIYSTLLGGTGQEGEYWTFPNLILGFFGTAVHVDAAGIATIASRTTSRDFPVTATAFQRQHGGGSTGSDYDGYVARVDRSKAPAQQVVWATFLGGEKDDGTMAVGLDRSGEPVVAGWSQSDKFPVTAGAYRTTYPGGSESVTVSRLSSDGKQLVASTYFGGTDREYPFAVAVESSGAVTFGGYTYSLDLPTTAGAFQPHSSGPPFEGYVARLSPELTELWYATHLGGDANDLVQGLDGDGHGGVVVAAITTSRNFPVTPNAFQESNAGGPDGTAGHLDMLPIGVDRKGAVAVYQGVTAQPREGARDFRVTCNNAPANAPGVVLIGSQHNGMLFNGARIYVDVSGWVVGLGVRANGLGHARVPLLLPAKSAGLKFATQFAWVRGNGFVASNGLHVVVQ